MMIFGMGDKALIFCLSLWLIRKYCCVTLANIIFTSIIAYKIYQLFVQQTKWKRLGIPGPWPLPFFGHYFELVRKGPHMVDLECTKKYGKTFGLYNLTDPDLITSDLELAKFILVKDFHCFTNRRELREYLNFNDYLSLKFLTTLKDAEWKTVRSIVSPAFTSGKLKHMTPLINNSVETLMEVLSDFERKNEPFDAKEKTGLCILEIIAATTFGAKIDCQRNPNDEFYKYSNDLVKLDLQHPLRIVEIFFPFIMNLVNKFTGPFAIEMVDIFFRSSLKRIIEERRKNPLIERSDFLQLLINAVDKGLKNSPINMSENNLQNHVDDNTTKKDANFLSTEIIMAQCFLFLVAGYETTSITLEWALYFLALNPEVQQKCYEEISSNTNNEDITYDDIQNKFEYLDAIICETLRLFPPLLSLDRDCKETMKYDNGVTIPKGATVCISVYAIHRDEENYPDPEKFEPERFMPSEKAKRNPLTYLPFGYGPRNCIGMRMAMIEMKFLLARLILKFQLKPCPKTEPYPPKTKVETLVRPKNRIWLSLEAR